ncbi:hypothetical protein [Bifidobacterium bombi]|uniref:Head-to-tail stopper n=1 Tax=Bifidobacterium bombi DSM 19703 TaxID=1341695 RepID=A0A080N4R6_9BIFI|nr:hypothetical protein [Bifidobacterium bombi]KFF31650.1 hypothetical protein BBOMB_1036 [Bifidobacterium bombi DSM 19703]
MTGIHGDTIVIEHRTLGEPDVDGETKESMTACTVEGCSVQPVTNAGDVLFEQDIIIGRWRVIGPQGVLVSDLVDGDDTIRWNGKAYRLSSAVQEYMPADGLGSHSEFYMMEDHR